MTLDAATISLIVGAIVTIVGAIAAAIVSIIGAVRANTERIAKLAEPVAAILGHVNSEKTAAEGRENTLKTENNLLRERLADQKSTAGLLAQAVAQRSRTDAAVPDAPVLDKIETNTAETAANTNRVEAKVDAIAETKSPLEKLVFLGRLTQAEADSINQRHEGK
jgi:hypothetical protein